MGPAGASSTPCAAARWRRHWRWRLPHGSSVHSARQAPTEALLYVCRERRRAQLFSPEVGRTRPQQSGGRAAGGRGRGRGRGRGCGRAQQAARSTQQERGDGGRGQRDGRGGGPARPRAQRGGGGQLQKEPLGWHRGKGEAGEAAQRRALAAAEAKVEELESSGCFAIAKVGVGVGVVWRMFCFFFVFLLFCFVSALPLPRWVCGCGCGVENFLLIFFCIFAYLFCSCFAIAKVGVWVWRRAGHKSKRAACGGELTESGRGQLFKPATPSHPSPLSPPSLHPPLTSRPLQSVQAMGPSMVGGGFWLSMPAGLAPALGIEDRTIRPGGESNFCTPALYLFSISSLPQLYTMCPPSPTSMLFPSAPVLERRAPCVYRCMAALCACFAPASEPGQTRPGAGSRAASAEPALVPLPTRSLRCGPDSCERRPGGAARGRLQELRGARGALCMLGLLPALLLCLAPATAWQLAWCLSLTQGSTEP